MKPSKRACAVLGTLLSMPTIATNAQAAVRLPDITVTLSGGAYPIYVEASLPNASVSFGSSSGIAIEGKGVTLLLLTSELSALGQFTAVITHYEEPLGGACNTPGDASGVILMHGEFHLVPTSLSPLALGILFLVSEFFIECPVDGREAIFGRMLGGLNDIGSEATELTGFGTTLVGRDSEQQLSEYYNDGGTRIRTKLISESSLGIDEIDENVEGDLGLSVLGSRMLVITNR
jgi:hypothetical protein